MRCGAHPDIVYSPRCAMKRSELRADPEQVCAWLQRSRDTAIERARGREGMSSMALRNSATQPADFRDADGKRVSPRDATPAEYRAVNGSSKSKRQRPWRDRRKVVPRDWTRRVFEMHGAVCVVTGQRAHQAHHAIPVQVLIREGLAEHAGDPRNGVPVTKRVHERHEQAVERILVACLPASVFEFAREHGIDWYLDNERIYPRIPPAWKGRLC